MKGMGVCWLIGIILLLGVIYSQPLAFADDDDDDDNDDEIICDGIVLSGNINDNIRVPSESYCAVFQADIKGKITLEENSTVDIEDSTIRGKIKGPDTSLLLLINSSLKGNIDVDGAIIIGGVGPDLFSVNGKIKSKGSDSFIVYDAVITGNDKDDDD